MQQQQIEWRRAKVLELSSQGHSQRETADTIHVVIGTINRDMAYLRNEAQENLKYHIQERLQTQYLKCQNGLDQVLKMAWNIIIIDSVNQTTKLQALSLISDCYKYQMDLSTNGIIVTDAIKYVNSKMDHLNTTEKKLLQDIKDKGDTEAEAEDKGLSENSERELEEQATHNGIF